MLCKGDLDPGVFYEEKIVGRKRVLGGASSPISYRIFLRMQRILGRFPLSKTLEKLWYHRKLPFTKYMKGMLTLPDNNKLWFILPSKIKVVIDDIYRWQVYDQLFEPQIGFIVLDAGAHIGVYSLRSAKRVGQNGLIIAVEPDTENYKILCRNIATNKYRNITPFKLALSDFEGKAHLYLCGHGSGLHSLIKGDRSGSKTDVSVTTVDKLLRILSIDKVDLMKIDVEGAELEVLKGSENSLRSLLISRMTIGVYHEPNEADEVKKYLESFDYKIHVIDFGGRRGKYLYAISR